MPAKSKSSMTTSLVMLDPVHPGEILVEEFLIPLRITKNQLAIDLGVPASRIDQISRGRPLCLVQGNQRG
jgi:hypothetical protein